MIVISNDLVGCRASYQPKGALYFSDGSTVMPEMDRYARHRVRVAEKLGADPECGDLYFVRADDGHVFAAFEDELAG